MSITKTYDYSTPSEYQLTNAQLVGGIAKLGFVPALGQNLNQNFNASTGFVYDAANVDFSGGNVNQLNRTDSNIADYFPFNTSKNGQYFNTPPIADLGGVISTVNPKRGAGCLNFDGASAPAGVVYNEIGGVGGFFSYEFWVRPNYSGTPVSKQVFMAMGNNGNTQNSVGIYHDQVSGNLRIQAYDDLNVLTIDQNIITPWNPVAGTWYHFYLLFSAGGGDVRFFLNGTQQGGNLAPGVFVRNGTSFQVIGLESTGTAATNFAIDEFIMYGSLKYTSNFTPSTSELPSTRCQETLVELPPLTYSGLGLIQDYEGLTTTEQNMVRYIVNGKYWNGSAWATSLGTYATASPQADVNTNLPTLVANGTNSVAVKIVFGAGNIPAWVDDLTLAVTGQQYAVAGRVKVVTGVQASSVSAFTETVVHTINTNLLYTIEQDGVEKYWNGAAWVVSDGSAAQSNTAPGLNTNLPSLPIPASNSVIKLNMYFYTNAQNESALLNANTLTYVFGAALGAPNTTVVYGMIRDHNGTAVAATIRFKQINKLVGEDDNNLMTNSIITATSNALTGFQCTLTPGDYYVDYFNDDFIVKKGRDGGKIRITVPEADPTNITDLI